MGAVVAEPIAVNVISMGLLEIGLLETRAPRFGEFLVGNTASYQTSQRLNNLQHTRTYTYVSEYWIV